MSIFKKKPQVQTSYMQGLTHAESLVEEWKSSEPGVEPRYLYERLVRSVLSSWPLDFQSGYRDFASYLMKRVIAK